MLQKMKYPVVSKTLLLVCFFFVSFFLFFLNTLAATYYGVSNTVANIRTGPGTGYSILGQTAPYFDSYKRKKPFMLDKI